MRNMILLVRATDAQGRMLTQIEEPTVPDWGGRGQAPNDYADQPGKGYATVLENLWTEESPSVSYWRQTVVREDTRIPAFATDVSTYTFAAPSGSYRVKAEATLIFRRAFKALAETKGWELRDMVMATRGVVLLGDRSFFGGKFYF